MAFADDELKKAWEALRENKQKPQDDSRKTEKKEKKEEKEDKTPEKTEKKEDRSHAETLEDAVVNLSSQNSTMRSTLAEPENFFANKNPVERMDDLAPPVKKKEDKNAVKSHYETQSALYSKNPNTSEDKHYSPNRPDQEIMAITRAKESPIFRESRGLFNRRVQMNPEIEGMKDGGSEGILRPQEIKVNYEFEEAGRVRPDKKYIKFK